MFEDGKIALGVNYWASHAATKMWSRWDAEVVENDLKALAGIGIKILRVFPLWPDFQPLMILRSNCYKGGYPRGYAFTGERPLPDTEAGRAGVDEEMMERFEHLCDLASKYDMKLIVPLINGHMTFRIYTPPALDGLDAFTDPESLMWQVRFVRYFVKRMKHHKAISAWELGNESNCLSQADNRAAAWSWTSRIADTIKAQDSSRPVMSGMHSLELNDQQWEKNPSSNWLIADQAENCDILTTHPYSMWRNYINCDESNTIRWAMLPTTENTLYADISGKPSIVEEIGTLRRTFSDFNSLGTQLHNILWLLWANNAKALLWWCAFDQTGMEFPPYDWDEAGMEHGVMTCDYLPNPTGKAIAEFSEFVKGLPFEYLSPQSTDAVCILGRDQKHYELVNATNILAKQAGINLKFAFCEDHIPESQLYLIPGLIRKGGLNRAAYRQLMERVKNGATLYMSLDYNACIPEMPETLGLEIASRKTSGIAEEISLHLDDEEINFKVSPKHRFSISSNGATQLDESGLFWEYQCGKGRIITAALPLETLMLDATGSFQQYPVFKFYRYLGRDTLKDKAILSSSNNVIISEHPVSDTLRYAVIVNCSYIPVNEELKISKQWKVKQVHCQGCDFDHQNNKINVQANSGVVVQLERY